MIAVTINLKNKNGDVVKTESYEIIGEHYDLLMSESPGFADGKPANEYRESDLWYIIDMLRESQVRGGEANGVL